MESDRLERKEFYDIQFMSGVLPCLEESVVENAQDLESEMGSEPTSFISYLRVVEYLSNPSIS